MRNTINPIVLFSLPILAGGLFLIGMTVHDLFYNARIDDLEYWHARDFALLTSGLFLLVTGLGLLLRLHWARLAGLVVFGVIGVSWTIFLASELNLEDAHLIRQVSITLFVYSVVAFGLLFLSNTHLMGWMREEHGSRQPMDDILDA